MVNLILLGAPGSGKGTQAMKLVQSRGYEHVSTGNLLRSEMDKKTKLGEQIRVILNKGELVDDELVFDLLEKNCHPDDTTYIFDGFPRNIAQAKILDERLLKGCSYRSIYFNLSAEKLVQRLINRRVCSHCGKIYNLLSQPPRELDTCDSCGQKAIYAREDDCEDVIRNRMVIYHETITPVLEYYSAKDLLVEVAANYDEDKVYGGVVDALWKET